MLNIFSDGIDDKVVSFLQGNASFLPPTGVIVGDASRFVRAVDTSGDGNPEILVTHEASGTFTQLNNQDGVFIFDSSIAVPNPVEFVLGDIDGDQLLDVVIASFANTVEVILSSQPVAISLNAGCSAEGVDLGDVNNDGILDILSVCSQSAALDQVKLFSGEDLLAQGNATVPFKIITVPESRVGRVADFDADGLLDLAIVERTTNAVFFFFQEPNGDFTQIPVAVGLGIISMTVADMNRDGVSDLVTVEESDDQASILLSDGDRTFTKLVLPVGVGPRGVAIGDLNQDTLPDFATANREGDSITVYLSTP